jgi:hypothetical protein
LFILSALLDTWSLLPNDLPAPQPSPHLQVAQPHHHQGDQVRQDEVGHVVIKNNCDRSLFPYSPLISLYSFARAELWGDGIKINSAKLELEHRLSLAIQCKCHNAMADRCGEMGQVGSYFAENFFKVLITKQCI